MKYYLKTFGCQMNYADSEKIHMILLQSGLHKVLDSRDADIIILNTCSVRQKGVDKVYGYIREVRREAEKQGKNLIIGVTGCMVRKTGLLQKYYEAERKRKPPKGIEFITGRDVSAKRLYDKSFFNSDDKIFGITDVIDFTVRIEEIGYITKILSIIAGETIGNDAKWDEYLRLKQSQENPGSANIIIQTGCDNFCTYCIVPHTRGREISRPQSDILAEIREVVAHGTREITLLGQNVNSYGKETKQKLWNDNTMKWGASEEKTPFRELLEKINTIEGLDRIRFTSSNPHDMTPDILSAHFELPRMCHYLHFALQSGSDEILKRMNRKHTFADFKAQVDYLRSRDPLFAISTDIIVGFPGETEAQFEETVEAFRQCEFDFAYIARYSPRRGTYSADHLIDNVPLQEKARRWDILNTLLYESMAKRSDLMVGRTEEILISGNGRIGELVGRTRNFKEVRISQDPDISIGDLVTVKITERDRWILKGKRI
ncbi:MAG: MiaB/RimO family radical SAM methylthiotransferase [Candidatus Gracilibacteria bacterium]|nr:MiaB/RimO family radical SAM methylthiotransferase [Candidatus Gracilibacteria bacterium]